MKFKGVYIVYAILIIFSIWKGWDEFAKHRTNELVAQRMPQLSVPELPPTPEKPSQDEINKILGK